MWTLQVEELLSKFAKYCKTKAEVHEIAVEKYKSYEVYLGMPAYVLQGFAFILSLDSEWDWRSIVIPISLIISAVLTSIRDYYTFDVRSVNHQKAVVDYNDHQREIDSQLALGIETRQPAEIFLRNIRQKIARTDGLSPVLTTSIRNEYAKQLDSQLQCDNLFFKIANDTPIVKHDTDSVIIPIQDNNNNDLTENPFSEPDARFKERERRYEEFQLHRLNSNLESE